MDDAFPVFSVTLENEDMLRASYMPYLKHGGLFVATTQIKEIGERVQVKLSLLGSEPLDFTGTVAWVTPSGAQGNRPSGIGIHFEADRASEIKTQIEKALGNQIKSDSETDTI
ncbi:MAG: pilus assembly protein PilZ [Legionellales bacterium]|nr:pilus assembly protein PilZ [Legionellales bacterium]|tara:strand:+ start:665 stop:1003 length:339 start_codon:yes stop_codon:yes gene_type:complete